MFHIVSFTQSLSLNNNFKNSLVEIWIIFSGMFIHKFITQKNKTRQSSFHLLLQNSKILIPFNFTLVWNWVWNTCTFKSADVHYTYFLVYYLMCFAFSLKLMWLQKKLISFNSKKANESSISLVLLDWLKFKVYSLLTYYLMIVFVSKELRNKTLFNKISAFFRVNFLLNHETCFNFNSFIKAQNTVVIFFLFLTITFGQRIFFVFNNDSEWLHFSFNNVFFFF